jgi:hypothetical protein
MRGAILPSVRWPLRRASREEARLLALRDGSPRPDGVFTPEAERQLRDALANGIERHNAEDERSVIDDLATEPEREFPAVKTGQQPYADITASQLAAYRLAAASEEAPVPEFHPAPAAAPVTAPTPVLPGNAALPPPPPPSPAPRRPPAADVPDLAVLRDVRDGLRQKWQAERAEEFSADRQELPWFAAMISEYGWTGLHVPVRSQRQFSHQRWTTERWFAQAIDAIRAATDAAKADVHAQVEAGRDRLAQQAFEDAFKTGGSR